MNDIRLSVKYIETKSITEKDAPTLGDASLTQGHTNILVYENPVLKYRSKKCFEILAENQQEKNTDSEQDRSIYTDTKKLIKIVKEQAVTYMPWIMQVTLDSNLLPFLLLKLSQLLQLLLNVNWPPF